MDRLGLWHTLLASAALALGAVVVVRRKADRLHRTVGHLYVAAMLGTCVTALNIYDLFGRFGPFHVAAVVSLATVLAGLAPVVTRRPRDRWFAAHAYFMSWSYVGLVAAAVSELAVRVPAVPFAPAVVLATLAVTVGGAMLLHGRRGALIRGALRKAGLVSLLCLVTTRKSNAQEPLDSLIERHRRTLDAAVARVDAAAIAREREQLARLASTHGNPGLLLHYVGYAWYREALIGPPAHRSSALDSAEAALERSARLLPLAETYALLSTVVGQQIGRSPWKGMLHGSRVDREIRRALELDPTNPRIAVQQGINAFHAPPAFGGGIDRARGAFERAVSLFERYDAAPLRPSWGHAEAWAWLGRARLRTGDTTGARSAYETALKVDSTYAWVSRVLLPQLGRP